MLILGIDPGTARMGWGVVLSEGKDKKGDNNVKLIDYGCFETKVGERIERRLLQLKQELVKVIDKHRPDNVAIEQLFFGANSRTAMTVGLARGVVMLTVEEKGISIFEYQGLSVKKALTGFGHTDKKQIQEFVKKKLKMKEVPRPDDAADALAIAICHSYKLLSV